MISCSPKISILAPVALVCIGVFIIQIKQTAFSTLQLWL